MHRCWRRRSTSRMTWMRASACRQRSPSARQDPELDAELMHAVSLCFMHATHFACKAMQSRGGSFRLQRDVPGLTRSAIPVLSSVGVRAISIGVNDASAPPGVPKNTPFIWQDARTNTSLIGMLHPGARPRVQLPGQRDAQSAESHGACVTSHECAVEH